MTASIFFIYPTTDARAGMARAMAQLDLTGTNQHGTPRAGKSRRAGPPADPRRSAAGA
ncbi:MAG: hypothetical protein ACREEW_04500 [Caulobacteraceae bacterium]